MYLSGSILHEGQGLSADDVGHILQLHTFPADAQLVKVDRLTSGAVACAVKIRTLEERLQCSVRLRPSKRWNVCPVVWSR